MGRVTVSLLTLLDEGVKFPRLPDWATLPQMAEELGISYPGAVYLVLDQQVFDLGTQLCLVGERTLLVRRAALEAYKLERAAEAAEAALVAQPAPKTAAKPAVIRPAAKAA